MSDQLDQVTDIHVGEAALSAVIDKLTEIVENPQSVGPSQSASVTPPDGKPQEIVVEIIEEAPNVPTRPAGQSQISIRILSDLADQKQICDLDSQISSALKGTSQDVTKVMHHEDIQAKDNLDASSVVVVESVHKCEECDYSSANKHYLKQHIDLVHNASRIYKCPFCDYAGKRSHSLKEHLIIHSNDRPFECTQCNATFRKKGHLTNHIKMHATRCEICDFKLECESKENIVEHMRSAHGKQEVFFCSECNFFTVAKERVVAHIDTGHKKSPSRAAKQADKPVEFLYKCSICDHECSKNEDMVAHIKELHVPTPQVFPKKGSVPLKAPLTLKSPPAPGSNKSLIMKCSVCGYETKNQSELKQHMWQHVQGDTPSASASNPTFAMLDTNKKSAVSDRLTPTGNNKAQISLAPNTSKAEVVNAPCENSPSIVPRNRESGERSSPRLSINSKIHESVRLTGSPKAYMSGKPLGELPSTSDATGTLRTILSQAPRTSFSGLAPNTRGESNKTSGSDPIRRTQGLSSSDSTRGTPKATGSDPTEYLCGDCSFKSTQVYPFITHMLSHKPKLPASPVSSGAPAPSTTKCTMAKENTSKAFSFNATIGMFYCRVCGYQCESQRTIKSHIWKHTGHKDIDYPMFQNGPLSIYEGTPLAQTRKTPSTGTRNKPEALGNPHDNIFTIGKNTRVKLIDQHTAILKVDEPIKVEMNEPQGSTPSKDQETPENQMIVTMVPKKQQVTIRDLKPNQDIETIPSENEYSGKQSPLNIEPMINREDRGPTSHINAQRDTEKINEQMAIYASSDSADLSKSNKEPSKHVNVHNKSKPTDCRETKCDISIHANSEQHIVTSQDDSIEEHNEEALEMEVYEDNTHTDEGEADNEEEEDELEGHDMDVDCHHLENCTKTSQEAFIPPAATVKNQENNVVVEHVTEGYNTPRFTLVDSRHNSPRAPDIGQHGDLPAYVALQPISRHPYKPLPDDDSALTLLSLLKKGPNYNPAYPVGQPLKQEDSQKGDHEPDRNSPPVSVTDSQGTDDSKPKSGICSSLLAVIEQLRERSKSGGESAEESVEEKVVVSVPRARGRNKKVSLSRKPKDDVLESNDKVEWIRDSDTLGFFRCKLCHYTSASVSYMKQHMRFHKSKKPFECSLCTYIAPSSESLQDHMLLHCKVRTYSCKLCDSVFSYKSQLRAHLRAHNYLESFMCDLCDFETKDAMKFRVHMLDHEVKMFKCSVCHQLMEYSDLSAHSEKCRKSVTSNTAYQCNQCRFVAGDENEAREHAEECHLGNKSQKEEEGSSDNVKYKCEHCEYTSTTYPAVKLHMKVHDEASILKCGQCDFSAMSLRSLKSHMKRHINDQRYVQQPLEQYKCNLCGYVCHHLPSLKSHMWRHASDENYSYEITNEIINAAIDFDNMTSVAELKKSELKPDKMPEQPFDYKGKEKYCFVTFRCCQCGFETIDKPLLSDHMKSHSDVIRHTLEIKHQEALPLSVQTDTTDLNKDAKDDEDINSIEDKKSPLHEAQTKKSPSERKSRKRVRKSDIEVPQENMRSSKKPNLLVRKSQRKLMHDRRKARSSLD
ncbi:unnamed protein product [Owenia fusiformis]|uniref:Uncharacterized protein n=1 Tax=Owenia fusiformis TaxID=6347 RepID=A0A8J1URA9_OWEFU|nr:unnamed protein product [Owenia fusiformis]